MVTKTKTSTVLNFWLLAKDYFRSAAILFEENQYRDSLFFLCQALEQLLKTASLLGIKDLKLSLNKVYVLAQALEKTIQKNGYIFPEEQIEGFVSIFEQVKALQRMLKKQIPGISFWTQIKTKISNLIKR